MIYARVFVFWRNFHAVFLVFIKTFPRTVHSQSMSDQELRDLVAANHLALQQLIQAQREDREQMQAQRKELAERYAREDAERAREDAERAKAEAERAKAAEEYRKEQEQKAEEYRKEQDRKDEAFKQQMAELGKQIGGLGNRFGSFTESLILPSMARILYDEFGVDHVSIRTKSKRNGGSLELDAFGYSNGTKNVAYVVEVKASIRKRDVEQILEILSKFPQYFTDHAEKHLYGIIAGLDAPEDVRKLMAEEGIYYADITDDVFQMDTPEGFQPRDFSLVPA